MERKYVVNTHDMFSLIYKNDKQRNSNIIL